MRKQILIIFILIIIFALAGCNRMHSVQSDQATEHMGEDEESKDVTDTALIDISPTEKITELKDGFSVVQYEGDYGFDKFLSEGGASSDREVIGFLTENLLGNIGLGFTGDIFGCSTIMAQNAEGGVMFGRNFDWNSCDAMVVMVYPANAYTSVSTVNVDFIRQGAGGLASMALKADEIRTVAVIYAPLDGMNEKGLAVSVNMIQDSATINQDTEKPDITTTTAIRLLLDDLFGYC